MNSKLDLKHVVKWFDAVRNSQDKDRLLESFWNTQIHSKQWLISILANQELPERPLDIVIHGGWNGVLASMMFQLFERQISQITTVDIDPSTVETAYQINDLESKEDRFRAVAHDMADYEYNNIPDIVINTSCEHIDNVAYNKWLFKVPETSLIVCQSNNNFSLEEHVACSNNISEFAERSNLRKITFMGNYPCNGYTRFMIMGYK